MISDVAAQRIASAWHGGGGSALYVLASTGAIPILFGHVQAAVEITDTLWTESLHRHSYPPDLVALLEYVRTNAGRAPVADWYSRVICAAESAEASGDCS